MLFNSGKAGDVASAVARDCFWGGMDIIGGNSDDLGDGIYSASDRSGAYVDHNGSGVFVDRFDFETKQFSQIDDGNNRST